jgi:hypothetical protein
MEYGIEITLPLFRCRSPINKIPNKMERENMCNPMQAGSTANSRPSIKIILPFTVTPAPDSEKILPTSFVN